MPTRSDLGSFSSDKGAGESLPWVKPGHLLVGLLAAWLMMKLAFVHIVIPGREGDRSPRAKAERIAALFAGTNVDARVISAEPGAASALKAAYAGRTKGSAALLLLSGWCWRERKRLRTTAAATA